MYWYVVGVVWMITSFIGDQFQFIGRMAIAALFFIAGEIRYLHKEISDNLTLKNK